MDAAALLPDPLSIRPLAEVDPAAVDALLDQAFGPDRRSRTAYRIREGMSALPALSFCVVTSEGLLAGSLQCWPVALDAQVPLILVGPVAVAPAHQGRGIGRMMMERMIARAERDGADPLVLIGDPEYYGRFFGFTAEPARGWRVPGPVEQRRLLARVPHGLRLPEAGLLGPRA